MKIGEGVEWALHSCTVLGTLPSDAALPAARLAEYHDVPPAYLAKHLQALSRAGIVESIPGPKGGYRLARPPAEITVLDVVEAVEGGGRAFRCTEIRRKGPCAVRDPKAYPKPCGIARVMHAAEDAWRESLAFHTVADLIMSALADAPPQNITNSIVWVQEVVR